MLTEKVQPWFVGKRAEAFVYSLLAAHDVTLRDEKSQEFGVDFVVDLRERGRETGRFLAVQVLAYPDFPSTEELNKNVTRRIPAQLRNELSLPFVVFVVQVKELGAVYCWINEPRVANGAALLRSPDEFEWKSLNDQAVGSILEQVNEFWIKLLGQVRKNHR